MTCRARTVEHADQRHDEDVVGDRDQRGGQLHQRDLLRTQLLLLREAVGQELLVVLALGDVAAHEDHRVGGHRRDVGGEPQHAICDRLL